MPISHRLNSGDQVEILTSNSQHVSESWLQFATTAKAITKIQAILRRDNRELQKQGEQVLSEWLKANDIEASMSVLDKLCEIHDKKKHEDLYLALGKKTIELGDKDIEQVLKKKTSSSSGGWRRYVPFLRSDNTPDKPMPISQYVFPKCCHPIPGDDTLGYIDNKKHIEIHNRTCPVAAKLKTSFGNRILDAQWDMHDQLFFDATIRLRGIDRKGMLLDVSEVLSGHLSLNIHHITISSENGIFDGTVDVKVHDRNAGHARRTVARCGFRPPTTALVLRFWNLRNILTSTLRILAYLSAATYLPANMRVFFVYNGLNVPPASPRRERHGCGNTFRSCP